MKQITGRFGWKLGTEAYGKEQRASTCFNVVSIVDADYDCYRTKTKVIFQIDLTSLGGT